VGYFTQQITTKYTIRNPRVLWNTRKSVVNKKLSSHVALFTNSRFLHHFQTKINCRLEEGAAYKSEQAQDCSPGDGIGCNQFEIGVPRCVPFPYKFIKDLQQSTIWLLQVLDILSLSLTLSPFLSLSLPFSVSVPGSADCGSGSGPTSVFVYDYSYTCVAVSRCERTLMSNELMLLAAIARGRWGEMSTSDQYIWKETYAKDHTQTHKHMCTQTHKHTNTRTHKHTSTQTHTLRRHIKASSLKHTYIHTHTPHTHPSTPTQTRTHTQLPDATPRMTLVMVIFTQLFNRCRPWLGISYALNLPQGMTHLHWVDLHMVLNESRTRPMCGVPRVKSIGIQLMCIMCVSNTEFVTRWVSSHWVPCVKSIGIQHMCIHVHIYMYISFVKSIGIQHRVSCVDLTQSSWLIE